VAAYSMIGVILLAVFSAHATTPEPERKVEISIYDLVNRKSHRIGKDKVDREYIEKILSALRANQSKLSACLKSEETLNSTFTLKIAKDGVAQVHSASETSLEGCTREALKRIEYPTHSYRGAVEVEVPIEIQKQLL
jgi:hypothetical protein